MSTPGKQRHTKITAIVIFCLIVLGLLAAAIWAWDTCTVTYVYPDGSSATHRTLRGFAPMSLALPETEEGWAFVGWQDENGNLLPEHHVQPREDMVLTARVMPILGYGAHMAFLPPLENGMFCPTYAMTQGDGVLMLGRLSGKHTDNWTVAAQWLRQLDVLTNLTRMRR